MGQEGLVPNNSGASLADYDNIRSSDVNNPLVHRGMGLSGVRVSPRGERDPSAHAIGAAILAKRGSFKQRRRGSNNGNGSVGNTPRRGSEERPGAGEEAGAGMAARERVALTDAEEQSDIAAAIAASLADAQSHSHAPQAPASAPVEPVGYAADQEAGLAAENLTISGMNSQDHSAVYPRTGDRRPELTDPTAVAPTPPLAMEGGAVA